MQKLGSPDATHLATRLVPGTPATLRLGRAKAILFGIKDTAGEIRKRIFAGHRIIPITALPAPSFPRDFDELPDF